MGFVYPCLQGMVYGCMAFCLYGICAHKRIGCHAVRPFCSESIRINRTISWHSVMKCSALPFYRCVVTLLAMPIWLQAFLFCYLPGAMFAFYGSFGSCGFVKLYKPDLRALIHVRYTVPFECQVSSWAIKPGVGDTDQCTRYTTTCLGSVGLSLYSSSLLSCHATVSVLL